MRKPIAQKYATAPACSKHSCLYTDSIARSKQSDGTLTRNRLVVIGNSNYRPMLTKTESAAQPTVALQAKFKGYHCCRGARASLEEG